MIPVIWLEIDQFGPILLFPGTHTHGSRPSTCCHSQIAHPNRVVGGRSQHKLEVELFTPYKPALAQPANGLEPAEAFFDPLADRQAGSVSGVAGGAPVDGRGMVV